MRAEISNIESENKIENLKSKDGSLWSLRSWWTFGENDQAEYDRRLK